MFCNDFCLAWSEEMPSPACREIRIYTGLSPQHKTAVVMVRFGPTSFRKAPAAELFVVCMWHGTLLFAVHLEGWKCDRSHRMLPCW